MLLYNASVRDALLTQAETPAFYLPRWSEEILEETRRNLIRHGRIPEEKAARLISVMREAFPEASVSGFESLIAAMTNHHKDRHALPPRSNAVLRPS